MKKYFFDNGEKIGLKADIKRHNEEEKELISKYNSSQCLRLKNAYLNFLYQLYLSKNALVEKIGRKSKNAL